MPAASPVHQASESFPRCSRRYCTVSRATVKTIVRLPPLPGEGQAAADGIAIDSKTGDIWFAEYWRHRLGRLRRQ